MQSSQAIKTVKTGNIVHGLDIADDGKIYVSSRKEPKIWVVDQNSLNVLSEVILPADEGHRIAIVKKQEVICTH